MDFRSERAFSLRQKLLTIALGLALLSEALSAIGVGGGIHADLIAYVRYGNIILSSCLLAGAIVFLASRPSRSSVVGMLAIGTALEIGHAAYRADLVTYASNVGAMYGVAALLVALADAVKKKGLERRHALLRLTETALFPAFLLVARLPVELSVILHPVSLDAQMFAVDRTVFGGDPSFAVGRLFASSAPLRVFETFVYIEIPVAAALVYLLDRRTRAHDVQIAFLVAGIIGVVLYHLCPIAGPRHAFAMFPGAAPPVEQALQFPYLAGARFRNAIPSLHTTWSLLVFWHARRHGPGMRALGAAWVILTILAMLGLGEHYLTDVAVSVPFAVACRAALATSVPLRERVRWLPVAVGALLFVVWTALLRAPAGVLTDRFIFATLAALSVAAPLLLESRLATAERGRPSEREGLPGSPTAAPTSRRALVVAVVFFASGFAGLVYEVVFAKSLGLVFGSGSTASTTVLATYMGGMALGAYVGGRVRARSALRSYAFCELGVALACALVPIVVPVIKGAYVSIAAGSDPAQPGIVVLQMVLGAAVLLPPTVLMGMTLPILGRYFDREDPTLGRSVALLYGANTAGAAVGAMLTGYVLIPSLGVLMTTMVGVVLNLGVALVALRLETGSGGRSAASRVQGEGPPSPPPESPTEEQQAVARLGLCALFIGGLVSLGLEVTYMHLLAVVVGNSTFAFSSMLTAFLVGLAGGASVGRAWLRRRLPVGTGIGLAQAGLVVTVLVSVFAWNAVPGYFASYAGFHPARTFAISEFIRFVTCGALLVPPALFIGASYPLAIDAVVAGSRGDRVRALGSGAAVNTVGNITGAIVTSFALLPALGSLRTIHALMAGSLLVVCVCFVVARGWERRVAAVAVGAVVLLAVVQPRSFDLTRLSLGANVYFSPQFYGTVIDQAESVDGGLTTVNVSADADGRLVKTMLTNGKFQGDDSPVREMRAQYGFALLPLLHTEERGRALIVGLGTGVSTRAVHDAGFAQVEVAELSRDVITIAKRHFQSVNAGVLDRPGVSSYVTDGRNFLALSRDRYDLIGLEISSIWFAGAASLYNAEFYETTKARLTPNGVLQQWIQLHHVDSVDIATMIASARSIYPHVWVYIAGNQGILIACQHDCRPTAEALAKIDATAALGDGLQLLGGHAAALLGNRVLAPESVDRLLASLGAPPSDPQKLAWLVSNDDNLFLEYHTPRGNMRPYDSTLRANAETLRRFSPADPFVGTRLHPVR